MSYVTKDYFSASFLVIKIINYSNFLAKKVGSGKIILDTNPNRPENYVFGPDMDLQHCLRVLIPIP
jgi:hypothetical protein